MYWSAITEVVMTPHLEVETNVIFLFAEMSQGNGGKNRHKLGKFLAIDVFRFLCTAYTI
jgi:hypothetical protein